MVERAKSVAHAEYEILNVLIEGISLCGLERLMVKDEHSRKRFAKAGENLLDKLGRMRAVRAKQCGVDE